MSCKLKLTTGGLTLKNINLKYLSTKTDNYGSEYCYYEILNDNFKDEIKSIEKEMKVPYFLGKENKYILRIKSRYVKDNDKVGGTALINMKEFEYNEFCGYYINSIEIK